MKKIFQEHPEYGKKHSEKLKKHYSDPEIRAKHRESIKKAFQEHPEYRKKISERLKKVWDNKTSDEREKIVAKFTEMNRREDVREKNSISVRKRMIQIREERLKKNQNPSKRSRQNQARRNKFYLERDKYYNMTKKIDNARTYGLMTEAEAFIRFFSATK
jgi:hypothetical protein